MAARHNFRKLMIWKEGVELAKKTYATTKKFPKHEFYGIANQMQRCAVSIPSNIAEGTAKSTDKHFLQYEKYENLEIEIQKIQGMITRFMESLSN
jgi:uridine phosphorylase